MIALLPVALVEFVPGRYVGAVRHEDSDEFHVEVDCPACQGRGLIEALDSKDQVDAVRARCETCGGMGTVTDYERRLHDWKTRTDELIRQMADGRDGSAFCSTCGMANCLPLCRQWDRQWVTRVVDAHSGEPSVLWADESFRAVAEASPLLHAGEHLERLEVVDSSALDQEHALIWDFAVRGDVMLLDRLKDAYYTANGSNWDETWLEIAGLASDNSLAQHGIRRLPSPLRIISYRVSTDQRPLDISMEEVEAAYGWELHPEDGGAPTQEMEEYEAQLDEYLKPIVISLEAYLGYDYDDPELGNVYDDDESSYEYDGDE